MKILISVFIWITGIIYVTFFLLFILVCTYIFPEKVYDPLLKKMLRFLFILIGTKVEVEGQQYVTPGKTYLFMANHVSLLDPPLLGGFIPGTVRGLEAHVHFSWPLYGFVMKRLGNIPVDRESVHKSVNSFRKVQNLLESGRSMIILPEGHRTPDGRIRPFKKLPFAMAKQTNSGIIPVGLSGLYNLNRKGSWIISPSRIKISFGPEITNDQIASLSIPELRDHVQNEIARLVERP
jgi:1-acyl-sn-glycerol-3-phosphate acyltransferase